MKKIRVTEKDYNQIKMFLDAGVKASVISKVLVKSYATIYRVLKSKDFTAFEEEKRIFREKQKSDKLVSVQTGNNKVQFTASTNDLSEVANVYVRTEIDKIVDSLVKLVALIPTK